MRELIEDSEIRESHRDKANDPRVQDAYALRCMPQVHGAVRDALAHVRSVIETEINSATDNPLVFATAGNEFGFDDRTGYSSGVDRRKQRIGASGVGVYAADFGQQGRSRFDGNDGGVEAGADCPQRRNCVGD